MGFLSGGSSSPRTESSLTGDQQTIAGLLTDVLSANLGQPGLPFQGERFAPLISGFQDLANQLSGVSLEGSPQETETLSRLLSGEPSTLLDPQETARNLETAVLNPLLDTFRRKGVPALEEAFAGQGGSRSSRLSRAKQQGLGDIFSSFGSQLAGAQVANQQANAQLAESAQQRSLQALGLTSVLNPFARAQQALGPLSILQGFEQQQRDFDFSEFLRTQGPDAQANTINQALGFTGQSQLFGFQPQQQSSGLGSLFGGLAGAALGPLTGGLGGLFGGGGAGGGATDVFSGLGASGGNFDLGGGGFPANVAFA